MHTVRQCRNNKDVMVIKIDLVKAYDRVDWTFLHETLNVFGFPSATSINCTTKASFSILWNGEKLPKFKAARGLQQGNPLSPYLFMLYM